MDDFKRATLFALGPGLWWYEDRQRMPASVVRMYRKAARAKMKASLRRKGLL